MIYFVEATLNSPLSSFGSSVSVESVLDCVRILGFRTDKIVANRSAGLRRLTLKIEERSSTSVKDVVVRVGHGQLHMMRPPRVHGDRANPARDYYLDGIKHVLSPILV